MKPDDNFWKYVIERVGSRKATLLYEHYEERRRFGKGAIIAFIAGCVLTALCFVLSDPIRGIAAFVGLVAFAIYIIEFVLLVASGLTLYSNELDNLKWGYDYERRTRPNYIDKLLKQK